MRAAWCRRLVINGGFRVDGGRYRQLDRRAGALGYPDLRTCLQALCDAGYSTPRLAKELDSTSWLVSRALRELGVRLPARAERLAQQRRRAAEERIAARVMELGFADVRAYLGDRIVGRGWLVVVEVVAELGAAPGTVRRLVQCHGVRRVRRTAGERAPLERGRRVREGVWQARRAARLAELGFADLSGYLRVRWVEQGWSVRRMRAELGVGRAWLVAEMRRLGFSW